MDSHLFHIAVATGIANIVSRAIHWGTVHARTKRKPTTQPTTAFVPTGFIRVCGQTPLELADLKLLQHLPCARPVANVCLRAKQIRNRDVLNPSQWHLPTNPVHSAGAKGNRKYSHGPGN